MSNYLVIFPDCLVTHTTTLSAEVLSAANKGNIIVIDITHPNHPARLDVTGWKLVEDVPERI